MPNRVAFCRELRWDEGEVPAWVQLLPLGPDVVGEDGRRWTLDDPDAFVARSTPSLPRPFDWEHATELKAPKGEPAPAAGWIVELAVFRDDAPHGPGVWAKVDWTPRGADSLRSQEYRFQSPVFTHTADGRIQELVGAGLTNRPNLTLRALNRATEPEEKTMDEETRMAFCSRLKLAASTPVAAIVVALNARLDSQEQELTTARGRVTELETAANAREVADLQREAETLVGDAMKAGKIAPATEAGFRALCSSRPGIEQARAIIDTLPSIHAPTTSGDVTATTKLAANAAQTPAGGSAPAKRDANGKRILTAAEKAHCSKQGLNEDTYASVLDEEDGV